LQVVIDLKRLLLMIAGAIGGLLAVLIVIGIVWFAYISPAKERKSMENELSKIQWPSSFIYTGKHFDPSGLDNDAILTATYRVAGTREEVFNQVVSSLGLNPADHQNSSDQELHGVGSPKYKYLYFLEISPPGETIIAGDPCAAGGANDQQYHECVNKDPKRGKNVQAKSIKLDLIKRQGSY